MSAFDSPNFKRVKAEYYLKLAESGFKDIECSNGRIMESHTQNSFFKRHQTFRMTLYEETREYYDWAAELVHRGMFESERDKQIWTLHSEGKTASEIGFLIGLDGSWINRLIRKLRRELLIN